MLQFLFNLLRVLFIKNKNSIPRKLVSKYQRGSFTLLQGKYDLKIKETKKRK